MFAKSGKQDVKGQSHHLSGGVFTSLVGHLILVLSFLHHEGPDFQKCLVMLGSFADD